MVIVCKDIPAGGPPYPPPSVIAAALDPWGASVVAAGMSIWALPRVPPALHYRKAGEVSRLPVNYLAEADELHQGVGPDYVVVSVVPCGGVARKQTVGDFGTE